MMITADELEEIIARTPAGERVVYENREIGSTDSVAGKLTQLKLSRSGDPHYLIFVGVDSFGECLLTAFATIGDPLDFRTRHQKGGAPDKSAAAETSNIPGIAESPGER
jgi:hypothetical protein